MQTGLQWLAAQVLPNSLSGIFGRILLAKLFVKMKDSGLLPKKVNRWLFHPMKKIPEVTAPLVTAGLTDEHDLAGLLQAAGRYAAIEPGVPQELVTALVTAGQVWSADVGSVLSRIPMPRTAAGEPKPPKVKPGVYPLGINEEAKDLWDFVLTEYDRDIHALGGSDLTRQWAAAILTFQNFCEAEGATPFDANVKLLGPTPAQRKDRRESLCLELTKAGAAAHAYVMKVEEKILAIDEDFEQSEVEGTGSVYNTQDDTYRMVDVNPLDLSNFTKARRNEVEAVLQKSKFKWEHGTLVYKSTKFRYQLVLRKGRGSDWNIEIHYPFNDADAQLLTGMTQRKGILRKLTGINVRWHRSGKVPTPDMIDRIKVV